MRYTNEPYRTCPICRNRLRFIRKQREHGVEWEVYDCPPPHGDGSEVWIDPYKGHRESRKGWFK